MAPEEQYEGFPEHAHKHMYPHMRKCAHTEEVGLKGFVSQREGQCGFTMSSCFQSLDKSDRDCLNSCCIANTEYIPAPEPLNMSYPLLRMSFPQIGLTVYLSSP